MKKIKQLNIIFGIVLVGFTIANRSIMAQVNDIPEEPIEQQSTEPVNDLVEKTFKKAREYDRKMEVEKAIEEYTKVIEIKPNHLEAYLFRSTNLVYVDPEKAIEDSRKVQELYELQGNQKAADAMEVHIETIRSGVERGKFDEILEPIPDLKN